MGVEMSSRDPNDIHLRPQPYETHTEDGTPLSTEFAECKHNNTQPAFMDYGPQTTVA